MQTTIFLSSLGTNRNTNLQKSSIVSKSLTFVHLQMEYFDEHNCTPLADGQAPDHFLHFARLLIDSGNWNASEFAGMFNDRPPPPTSKKFIDGLKDHLVRGEDEGECPICLKTMEQDDILNELPCKHKFHKECILPWLG